MTPAIHLHPTAPLAEAVLLPGDPGRALVLAQQLLHEPRMFNHNRGLWGYTGRTLEGKLLTIQSTGMGGPSAAIVVSELVELGARSLIRVGTCGGFDERLELGQLLLVRDALSADGTSRALGAGERAAPNAALLDACRHAGGLEPQTVVSTDLFYEVDVRRQEGWRARGAVAVEMECATLFALAHRLGVRAAAVLTVSDVLTQPPTRIALDPLRAAELRMGQLAARALHEDGSRPDG